MKIKIFCPSKRKINLISTFVHRAVVICSESNLQNKLSDICKIFINNSYPEAIINTAITKKMNQFRRPAHLDPKKCPVHLYLPWLSNVSVMYKMQIKTAVKRCYFAVKPRIVFTNKQLLSAAQKDILHASYQSNIVYQLARSCKPIRSHKAETSFSDIGQHLLQNPTCAHEYVVQ